uniref:Uncharacterized protein n=1 Tax=Tanacetum cinerariifolium TaxID=118510 RepID=A0A6L2MYT9_TANCI|nr:hypothetical protein [Tanacetum cinerariifolium]
MNTLRVVPNELFLLSHAAKQLVPCQHYVVALRMSVLVLMMMLRWIEDDGDNAYVYYLGFKSYGLMMDEINAYVQIDEGKALVKA